METPTMVKNAYSTQVYSDLTSGVVSGCVLPTTIKKEIKMSSSLRVVQVFIADTNESIPVDRRVLYEGDPKTTELTDQELFFEIDIKRLLEVHNDYRVTVRDKKIKDRVETLEPARIRDLKMVVVDIATF